MKLNDGNSKHGHRTIEILLVEDNPGHARITSDALTENSPLIHITTARSGTEALNFLHLGGGSQAVPRPDLILLDLNLPGKDGREVLATIKRDPKTRQIPIIVLSTSNARRDIENVYDLYGNGFITKPADIDEYFRMVTTLKEFWFGVTELPAGDA